MIQKLKCPMNILIHCTFKNYLSVNDSKIKMSNVLIINNRVRVHERKTGYPN